MLMIASPRPALHAFSPQPNLAMTRRRTQRSLEFSHVESSRIDLGTTVADDSLVIDSVPEDRLHELPAAIVSFIRWTSRRGYCPPIPALRRLGFRTRAEVEAERLAGCWRW